jgi:hypothetical protein
MSDHIVVFDGQPRLAGQTVDVIVEEATSFTLFGRVLTEEHVGVVDGGSADSCETTWPSSSVSGSQRIGLPLVEIR